MIEHRSRTIGVRYIVNEEDLKATWEEAQFEFGSKYQYEGTSEGIWDYYLVFCCDFDEASLSNEVRFQIENDRFCCRKTFLFNFTEKSFSIDLLLENLFPQIKSTGKITLLNPDTLIPTLKVGPHITKDFFTRQLDESEISKLAQMLIIEAPLDDKDPKA